MNYSYLETSLIIFSDNERAKVKFLFKKVGRGAGAEVFKLGLRISSCYSGLVRAASPDHVTISPTK